MRNFLLFALQCCSVGTVLGHDSVAGHHESHSFKDMIHEMCAGHHHRDSDELKEICNRFPAHFSGLLELQSQPPESRPERYLTRLVGLIYLSETLTGEQKHKFYRRSYGQAIEARKQGFEWNWLLGFLVEHTDALTLPELEELMSETSHDAMKPLIERAIERSQKRSGIRGDSPEGGLNGAAEPTREAEMDSPSSTSLRAGLPWVVAGCAICATLGVVLVKSRRTT